METINDTLSRLHIEPLKDEQFMHLETATGYLLSNYGRLWKISNGLRPKRHLRLGRYKVDIMRDDGKRTVIFLARAVANHFVRKVLKGETILQIDKDISNLHPDNLEIVPGAKFCHNLVGLRFGRLLVKARDIHNTRVCKKRDAQWICECDCGNLKTILTSSLKSKETVSCGCYQREVNQSQKRHFGFGNVPDAYWGEVKRGASSRGLSLEITPEYADAIYLQQDRKCALTGELIHFATYNQACKTITKGTASLDRIDSLKGYTQDNIQWLHTDVNRMKLHFTQEHFVDICRRVTNYLNGK